MMREVRLLLGQSTEYEYRGTIEAESRGLRFPVARPGWRRRWYRVAEGIVTFVIFIGLLVAFMANIVLVCSTIDGCLPS